MNMRQLEYLASVAARESYEKAASALYITPQAIAKSIKSLEKELGTTLVIRQGRSVQPTAFALALIERAKPLLRDFAELERFAAMSRQASSPVHVRLGIATIRHRALFFSLNDLDQFRADNPDIILEASIHTNETCFAGFDEGVFDAVVVMGERTGENAAVRHIASFDAYVALATNNPLALKRRLTLHDIGTCPIATPIDFLRGHIAISSRFAQEGLAPHFIEIEPTIDALHAFLDKGGIAFVKKDAPSIDSDMDVAKIPLEESSRIEFSLNLLCSEAIAPHIAAPLMLHFRKIWKERDEESFRTTPRKPPSIE